MGCMKQLHEHLERVSCRNLGIVMLGARDCMGHPTLKPRLENMLKDLSAHLHPDPDDVLHAFGWAEAGNASLWASLFNEEPLTKAEFKKAARAVRALIEAMEEEDEHD